jgi:AraC-like DNA-binding protein
MGNADYSYILAKSTQAEQSCRVDGFVLYHEHYEGFGTTPHTHDEIQIIVPLAGRMHIHGGGSDYLIGPEWACLVEPGTQHGFNCLDGQQRFLAIFAPADWLDGLRLALGTTPSPAGGLLVAHDVGIWRQGEQIAAELREARPWQQRALAASIDLLGIQFLRAMTPMAPPTPTVAEPRVLRAVDALLHRYAEDLTVEALASELAMSPRHFERCFKQAIGASPKKFLIEVRIGAGKELLRTSKHSVVEIALAVGFNTASHFSETFQRLTGQTPSDYRRVARQPAEQPV